MDQQAMEKGEEEHEAQKSEDEELPKSLMKHLQQSLDQQTMEKEEAEHEAQKSNDKKLTKTNYTMIENVRKMNILSREARVPPCRG